MQARRLVVVSGISGSGKSTALNALEDLGFFCVENLPAPLVSNFIDYLENLPESSVQLNRGSDRFGAGCSDSHALLVDCRDQSCFSCVSKSLKRIREVNVEVVTLFLDCDDEVIVRRFSETRRPHPLLIRGAEADSVREALACERDLLSGLRGDADKIIDTSSCSPHDLRKIIQSFIGGDPHELEVNVQSFGFKYGMPQDSDLVVDVRFLPNPHFVPHLREGTGQDDDVRDYVFNDQDAGDFVTKYVDLLRFLLPRYRDEGKQYLTISVGCTGGRHRSVAISTRIASQIQEVTPNVNLVHRDISRLS